MFLRQNPFCWQRPSAIIEHAKHHWHGWRRARVSVIIGFLLAIFVHLKFSVVAAPEPEMTNVSLGLPSSSVDPRKRVKEGARLKVILDKDYRLVLDGRAFERATNDSILLPLGIHTLKVETVGGPSNTPLAVVLDPDWGVGAWIWDHTTNDKQKVRLWRSFVIPLGTKVISATLDITADNGYRILLDGHEIGEGSDLRHITEYDLTRLLQSGRHVIAVDAFNDDKEAGVLAGLAVELSGGQRIQIPSDTSWRIVPENERGWENQLQAPENWPHAMVIGRFMMSPWAFVPAGFTRLPTIQPVDTHFWKSDWFQVGILSVCGIALLVCLQLMSRLAMNARSQELLGRERTRIARDIHDELGSGLTQLLLLGEVAKKEQAATTNGQTGIEQLCSKARGLSVTVDQIIWAVNSRHDTLQDFVRHTCKFAQSFFINSPIRCRLDVEAEIPPLPFGLHLRRNLFLAVKEALNNAAKYSEVTELFLRIYRHGAEIVVVVEDDGKGFDLALVSAERYGLTNLKQRMAEIGGTFEMSSEPGKGCRVTLKVPLSQRRPLLSKWFTGWQSSATTPVEPKQSHHTTRSPQSPPEILNP